jgi:hypothetical protein
MKAKLIKSIQFKGEFLIQGITPLTKEEVFEKQDFNTMVLNHDTSECFGILASTYDHGLPNINFNGFEDQVGYVDVEKLAIADFESRKTDFASDALRSLAIMDWCRGFRTAVELSRHDFSAEDVATMFEQIIKHIPEGDLRKWDAKSFTTHFHKVFQQPKTWDIECVDDGGVIKITKILI